MTFIVYVERTVPDAIVDKINDYLEFKILRDVRLNGLTYEIKRGEHTWIDGLSDEYEASWLLSRIYSIIIGEL